MNPAQRWVWIAVLTLSAAMASAQSVWVVDREQVNVRADATAQSARVAVLPRGAEVPQVRRTGPWIEVRLPEGGTGWIHGDLLQERLVIDGEGLRLREAPSTTGTSVTMLFRGQEVGRLGQRDGWSQVQLQDGRRGWVASRYVRPKTPADLAAQLPAPDPSVPREEAVAPASSAPPLAEIADAPPDDEFAILRRNPYAEGLQHEASGEHALALERFEEVLAADPAHLNALVHAAQAHRQLGEYELALDKLYRALVAGGGRRDVYLTLGEVYRLQAQPDSAAKYQALFRGEHLAGDGDAGVEAAASDIVTEGGEEEVQDVGSGAVDRAAAREPASPPPRVRRDESGYQSWDEDRDEPQEEIGSALTFDNPWMPVGLAGIGLLALAAVAWWVVSTTSQRHRRAGTGGRFQRVWADESVQAEGGKATPEEEVELDHQIDARWRELKEGAAAFGHGRDDAEGMDGILDQVEGLRRTLEGQDERERLYADIVRLQNMKIEAMTEEIRRLRRR